MDDSVQIKCSRCKSNFRDKARKVQSGYSRQCPSCEGVIFFEEGSLDKNIQKALLEAKALRKLIRADDEAKQVSRTPYVFGR